MPKKKKSLKKGVLIFLIGLFLVAFFFLFRFLFGTEIRNITVIGNKYIKEQEILEATTLLDYPDIFKVSSYKLEKQIKKIDRIKNVNVKKKWSFELEIEVLEYERLWIVLESNNVMLENGKEVPFRKDIDYNLPTLINYVPNTKYDKFREKWLKIDENIRNKVSEIKYEPNDFDEDRFLLYMNDQNSVYITLTKMDLFNRYNKIVEKLEGKKGILYLDSGNYFEIKG